MTASEVNDALETINFEPEIEYEQVTVDGSTVQRIKSEGGYYLPDGTFTPVSTEQEVQSLMGSTVSLPVINGKASVSKGPTKDTITPLNNTGSGSSSKKENWENPYDKFHNTLEQINDTIREREKLERRYQSLLDRQLMTLKEARDLYDR
jgi:hypothetical protein